MLNIRFSDQDHFTNTSQQFDPAFIATAPPIVYATSLITQHCKNEIVLKSDDNEGVIHIGKPTPYYTVAGVIYEWEQRSYFATSRIAENTFASWTIQMWIYLMEDSTGQHRALFF